MADIRIPQIEYGNVYYVIDGAQLIQQQDVMIVNDGQIVPAQNGDSGLFGIESASMGSSSNQLTMLNSSPYMLGSDLNNDSSLYSINNIEDTNGGNYKSIGHNDIFDYGALPPEMTDPESFVFQDMPDIQTLDLTTLDLDIIDLDNEGNFIGMDFGNGNLRQDSTDLFDNDVNHNTVQQQSNTASGTVPRITIRTKKIRKPRQNVIKEEPVLNTISTSYPPLEMLGISTPNTTQASNDTFEYNTPIPCISPIYQEDSLLSASYSSPNTAQASNDTFEYNTPIPCISPIYQEDSLPSTSYSSPVRPVSPSTSTSSYTSSSSPSTDSNSRRSRVNLATMSEAQRYRHIRDQNNESSRTYRQRKKMNLKETEAELQLQQERNTRLKQVFEALKHRKDTAHELMKGFVKDAYKHNM